MTSLMVELRGSNRSHRVHDLVSKDADQFLPGYQFLLLQFRLDILEGNQPVMLAFKHQLDTLNGQLLPACCPP